MITEPTSVPSAVEESLRCSTPLQLFARTVATDTEIHGVPVRVGDRVMLNYCSANRDPARYADPDEFQLKRAVPGHLAFGAGPHLCVGAPLARAQMRIAATELLAALPDMRLQGTAPLSGLIGGTLMTITELPVSFTTRARLVR